jgi:hypothetical protein
MIEQRTAAFAGKSHCELLNRYSYQSTSYTDPVTQSVREVKQTVGYQKKLEILMQDDVVINFAYVKAPINDVKNIPAP